MEFIIKKTTELSDDEKSSLLDCFVEVFVHERTLVEMFNQYNNTPFGYSIHSLCVDNGIIVAAHTAFPSFYWYEGKCVNVFITGDTMVKKDYRDGFVFLELVRGLKKYMKREGFSFSFGFPNEKSYPVLKKAKFSNDIGRLNTYCLPYRIGGVKASFKWINPLSRLFCQFYLSISGWRLSDDISHPSIHKDDKTYNLSRYNRMTGDYCHVSLENTEFYYKVKLHEGIRTAFLIDVIGKSERRFHRAVSYIMKHEKQNFDLLLYVGHLPIGIKKIGLLKIPQKYEPKHFYMTGDIYDKQSISEDVFYDINNWDVNLSDYDLI